MMEKLSISGKAFKAEAMSEEFTVGSGLPNWLVKALTIDFSLRRVSPLTSIFSTASNGVKIVANTSSNREPNEAPLMLKIIFRLREAAVNLKASGDNLENSPFRFCDLRMLSRRLLSCRT